MTETYTTDYALWNSNRARVQRDLHTEVIPLTVPDNLRTQFKGFTDTPVLLDEEDNVHACKVKVIDDGDSICNYNFDDCFLLAYEMKVSDAPVIGGPCRQNVETYIRFAGQETSLFNQGGTTDKKL
jgi:hypothetical protein